MLRKSVATFHLFFSDFFHKENNEYTGLCLKMNLQSFITMVTAIERMLDVIETHLVFSSYSTLGSDVS